MCEIVCFLLTIAWFLLNKGKNGVGFTYSQFIPLPHSPLPPFPHPLVTSTTKTHHPSVSEPISVLGFFTALFMVSTE